MSKRYGKPAGVTVALLNSAITSYHAELEEVKVRVGILMVAAVVDPEEGGEHEPPPALTDKGSAIAARIRLTNPKERVYVPFDAMIEIDEGRWKELEEPSRRALLDHELTHLAVCRDKDNFPLTTSDVRPKLAMRPDDWKLTGFGEVVKRHGAASLESMALQKLYEVHGQGLFPFMIGDPPPAATNAGKKKRKNQAA